MSLFTKSFAKSQIVGLSSLTAWLLILFLMANSLGRNYDEFLLAEKVLYWSINPLFLLGPILVGYLTAKMNQSRPWLSGFVVGILFVCLFLLFSVVKDQLAGFVMFGGIFLLFIPILTCVGGGVARERKVTQ